MSTFLLITFIVLLGIVAGVVGDVTANNFEERLNSYFQEFQKKNPNKTRDIKLGFLGLLIFLIALISGGFIFYQDNLNKNEIKQSVFDAFQNSALPLSSIKGNTDLLPEMRKQIAGMERQMKDIRRTVVKESTYPSLGEVE